MPGVSNDTGKGPYRHSPPVWKATLLVAPGDMVYRDTGDGYDKSAGAFPWTTDLPTTQTAFKAVFRGVSEARRVATQTADGGVGDGAILATGEFRFPCAALGSAAKPGDLIGPAKAAGNALEPQKWVIVTNVSYAVAVVTRDAASGDTFLYGEIHPATFDRGVQAVV